MFVLWVICVQLGAVLWCTLVEGGEPWRKGMHTLMLAANNYGVSDVLSGLALQAPRRAGAACCSLQAAALAMPCCALPPCPACRWWARCCWAPPWGLWRSRSAC